MGTNQKPSRTIDHWTKDGPVYLDEVPEKNQRAAAAPPGGGFTLAPAKIAPPPTAPAFAAAAPETQLLQALVNVGFPAAEAETMAQAAIAEIASRKAPALAGAAAKGK